MLRQHFRDLHPLDRVLFLKEGYFPRCERCAMQGNPAYPRHIRTKECQLGVERKIQRESTVSSALALCRQFTIHGDVLERVEVFKYLGRLLAQDDDDAQAIRQQPRKARGVWAHVGQVLRGENVGPRIAAKFYKGTSAHIPSVSVFLQPPNSGNVSYHSRARENSDLETVYSRATRLIFF